MAFADVDIARFALQCVVLHHRISRDLKGLSFIVVDPAGAAAYSRRVACDLTAGQGQVSTVEVDTAKLRIARDAATGYIDLILGMVN